MKINQNDAKMLCEQALDPAVYKEFFASPVEIQKMMGLDKSYGDIIQAFKAYDQANQNGKVVKPIKQMNSFYNMFIKTMINNNLDLQDKDYFQAQVEKYINADIKMKELSPNSYDKNIEVVEFLARNTNEIEALNTLDPNSDQYKDAKDKISKNCKNSLQNSHLATQGKTSLEIIIPAQSAKDLNTINEKNSFDPIKKVWINSESCRGQLKNELNSEDPNCNELENAFSHLSPEGGQNDNAVLFELASSFTPPMYKADAPHVFPLRLRQPNYCTKCLGKKFKTQIDIKESRADRKIARKLGLKNRFSDELDAIILKNKKNPDKIWEEVRKNVREKVQDELVHQTIKTELFKSSEVLEQLYNLKANIPTRLHHLIPSEIDCFDKKKFDETLQSICTNVLDNKETEKKLARGKKYIEKSIKDVFKKSGNIFDAFQIMHQHSRAASKSRSGKSLCDLERDKFVKMQNYRFHENKMKGTVENLLNFSIENLDEISPVYKKLKAKKLFTDNCDKYLDYTSNKICKESQFKQLEQGELAPIEVIAESFMLNLFKKSEEYGLYVEGDSNPQNVPAFHEFEYFYKQSPPILPVPKEIRGDEAQVKGYLKNVAIESLRKMAKTNPQLHIMLYDGDVFKKNFENYKTQDKDAAVPFTDVVQYGDIKQENILNDEDIVYKKMIEDFNDFQKNSCKNFSYNIGKASCLDSDDLKNYDANDIDLIINQIAKNEKANRTDMGTDIFELVLNAASCELKAGKPDPALLRDGKLNIDLQRHPHSQSDLLSRNRDDLGLDKLLTSQDFLGQAANESAYCNDTLFSLRYECDFLKESKTECEDQASIEGKVGANRAKIEERLDKLADAQATSVDQPVSNVVFSESYSNTVVANEGESSFNLGYNNNTSVNGSSNYFSSGDRSHRMLNTTKMFPSLSATDYSPSFGPDDIFTYNDDNDNSTDNKDNREITAERLRQLQNPSENKTQTETQMVTNSDNGPTKNTPVDQKINPTENIVDPDVKEVITDVNPKKNIPEGNHDVSLKTDVNLETESPTNLLNNPMDYTNKSYRSNQSLTRYRKQNEVDESGDNLRPEKDIDENGPKTKKNIRSSSLTQTGNLNSNSENLFRNKETQIEELKAMVEKLTKEKHEKELLLAQQELKASNERFSKLEEEMKKLNLEIENQKSKGNTPNKQDPEKNIEVGNKIANDIPVKNDRNKVVNKSNSDVMIPTGGSIGNSNVTKGFGNSSLSKSVPGANVNRAVASSGSPLILRAMQSLPVQLQNPSTQQEEKVRDNFLALVSHNSNARLFDNDKIRIDTVEANGQKTYYAVLTDQNGQEIKIENIDQYSPEELELLLSQMGKKEEPEIITQDPKTEKLQQLEKSYEDELQRLQKLRESLKNLVVTESSN